MSITSVIVRGLTGVPRSEVQASALKELADKFGIVASSASVVHAGTQQVIDTVAAANQGAALDAYRQSMTDTTTQLGYLRDKATATQQAHASAASLTEQMQLRDEAICVSAAQSLSKILLMPPTRPDRVQLWQRVVAETRQALSENLTVATNEVESAYAGILPIDQIQGLSEGERRGTVPPAVAAAYAQLTPDERMQFLRNLADQQMAGWPDSDRQEIVFYSAQKPQPPGTVPLPRPDWKGYNGVHSGDTVYLNYDIGVGNDPATGAPAQPTLMSTVVHEIQHSQQDRLRRRYDALSDADIAAIKNGSKSDPFASEGSTIHEVERFRIPYQGAGTPGYTHQPVEIDARRGGTETLDNMTEQDYLDLMP